jgi:hypothetical protein
MNKRALVHVRVTVRRITRHPLARKTAMLRKHVVRSATFGILPSALNDVVVHHAPLNLGEIIHATQDTVAVAGINALIILAKSVAQL